METNKKDARSERRRARRVYASFVEYCRVEDESCKKYQAFTENVSSTGIRIFINEEIKKDTILLITIYLLDGTKPIEVKGKIAWTRPSIFLNSNDKKHFDAGIEFVEIDKEDQIRITRYAEKHPIQA